MSAPPDEAPGAPPPPVVSAPPPPVPKATKARMELAADVLRLRDEQLEARVVYVDPSLQTNAELDAITAQVVADLQEMQAQVKGKRAATDEQTVEIELIKSLRELLEKMLSARRETFLRHKIGLIQRRVTHLFFSSELLEDPEASRGRDLPYAHADEALYHVLRRQESSLVAEFETMTFTDPGVKKAAMEQLGLFKKQLASQLLSRSRPELERLLRVYGDVLLVFLVRDFRESVGEFAWEVILESRAAQGHQLGYKIQENAFPAFRKIFERRFLEHLLDCVQEPLSERLKGDGDGGFRPETLRFAADPHIFAEICAVMCNTTYAYLHGEGFLDLPASWQEHLADL